MKITLLTVATLMTSLFLFVGSAVAQESSVIKNKEKTVYKVYQLAYGVEELCNRFSPEKAQQVSVAVGKFKNTYPKLVSLIDKSPYLEQSKKQMSEFISATTKNPELADCDGSLEILKELTDSETGRQAIAEATKDLE
jgi:hypothetical protein